MQEMNKLLALVNQQMLWTFVWVTQALDWQPLDIRKGGVGVPGWSNFLCAVRYMVVAKGKSKISTVGLVVALKS